MQEGHVICYELIKLNEHEINYVTHDLEFVSIIHALNIWRNYFLGIIFVLMKYHIGLRYLFDHPKLNASQSRWMDLLSEFDFQLKHIKGKKNNVVDSLSRSMKLLHLGVVRTYEPNIKARVKSAQ
jgi:hypothetical protein